MALRSCPDCGTRVSTKAYECPTCARVFKEKEGCFLQTLNLGCGIVAVIIIAFIILVIISTL